MGELNDTCGRCGKTEEGIGWFARGYRKMILRREQRDPGNLCGKCAGSETGFRIGSEIAEAENARLASRAHRGCGGVVGDDGARLHADLNPLTDR